MPPEGLHRIAEGLRASLHPIDSGATEEAAGVSYDSDAAAIFAAFTTPPTTARKGQINTCVLSLKSAGVWTKHDCIYVLAAADSQAATINWKNPGTFTLTIVNAPVFTADRGFLGASTKYLDSVWDPATNGSTYTQNSACLHVWSRTNVRINAANCIGVAAAGGASINPWNSSLDSVNHHVNNNGQNTFPPGNASGMFSLSRNASGSYDVYRNATSLGTQSTASVAPTSTDFRIIGTATTTSAREIAYGAWGGGLTSTEVTNTYNAINTYLVAVGAA